MAVTRTAVNPWPWSVAFGFDQAAVLEGAGRVLVCSGQAAVSADGTPQHPGDLAAQVSLTVDNIETVLRDAGMTLADLVRMTVYTTDVDAMMGCWGTLAERLDAAGVRPTSTLVGVTRLAFAELMVEIEVTAVA
ncbi:MULTISPECIES: RidA family protein [unclassified Geodermatophilus]|uniref:RidA family protein n=1 Tax=unclassified Geodermatophilus TaxID=2637632 RepID=UPI003EE8E1C0